MDRQWFPAGSVFFMLICLQEMQVKVVKTSSIHPEKEKEEEADRSAKRKQEMKAEMRRVDPVFVLDVI